MIQISLLQIGRGRYATPYDSTQGVPDLVFILFWIVIIAFGIRLGWEYRDKIFPKNVPENKKSNNKKI